MSWCLTDYFFTPSFIHALSGLFYAFDMKNVIISIKQKPRKSGVFHQELVKSTGLQKVSAV